MEWLISANHHKYDHTKAFNELPYIDWKQNANYDVGDLVFIYSSRPTSAIEYLVEVIKIDIDVEDALDDANYWTDLEEYYKGREKRKYARFKLLHHFDNNLITLDDLHENGLTGNIQGPRRLIDDSGKMLPFGKFIHERLDLFPLNDNKLLDSINKEIDELQIDGKTKEVIIKARVNQGIFRERLLKKYDGCCLCNVKAKEFLTASHIKPWSVSEPCEKLDINNGLLLCPNHDSLFDKGYISFDDEGCIIISELLSMSDRVFMNVHDKMKITLSDKNKEYLKYHRENILKNR